MTEARDVVLFTHSIELVPLQVRRPMANTLIGSALQLHLSRVTWPLMPSSPASLRQLQIHERACLSSRTMLCTTDKSATILPKCPADTDPTTYNMLSSFGEQIAIRLRTISNPRHLLSFPQGSACGMRPATQYDRWAVVAVCRTRRHPLMSTRQFGWQCMQEDKNPQKHQHCTETSYTDGTPDARR